MLLFCNKYCHVIFSSGIPAVIVGLVAAIRPVSFDMSKPLTFDVTCGSLHLTVRAERNRCGYNLNTVKSPMLCIGKSRKLLLRRILSLPLFSLLSTTFEIMNCLEIYVCRSKYANSAGTLYGTRLPKTRLRIYACICGENVG